MADAIVWALGPQKAHVLKVWSLTHGTMEKWWDLLEAGLSRTITQGFLMMIWKLWLLTSFLPLSAFWLDEVRSPPGPHVPTRRYCASTDLSNSLGQLTMD